MSNNIHELAKAVVATFPNTTVHTPQGAVNLRVLMVAIAGHESSWLAAAQGDKGLAGPNCHGYTSWSFFQIHNNWHQYLAQVTGSTSPCAWYQWLTKPMNSARAALHVYQTQGIGAWEPDIATGAWTHYKAQAEAAVKAVGGGTATASTAAHASSPPTPSSGTASSGTTASAASGPGAVVWIVAGGLAAVLAAWGTQMI